MQVSKVAPADVMFAEGYVWMRLDEWRREVCASLCTLIIERHFPEAGVGLPDRLAFQRFGGAPDIDHVVEKDAGHIL
jgi:hypothetical protein